MDLTFFLHIRLLPQREANQSKVPFVIKWMCVHRAEGAAAERNGSSLLFVTILAVCEYACVTDVRPGSLLSQVTPAPRPPLT